MRYAKILLGLVGLVIDVLCLPMRLVLSTQIVICTGLISWDTSVTKGFCTELIELLKGYPEYFKETLKVIFSKD